MTFSGAAGEGGRELKRGGTVGHQLQEAQQQPAHGHQLEQEEKEESFRVVEKGWKPL